jgi:hypothetical protein
VVIIGIEPSVDVSLGHGGQRDVSGVEPPDESRCSGKSPLRRPLVRSGEPAGSFQLPACPAEHPPGAIGRNNRPLIGGHARDDVPQERCQSFQRLVPHRQEPDLDQRAAQ